MNDRHVPLKIEGHRVTAVGTAAPRDLAAIVAEVEQLQAAGMPPFQALCAVIEDHEWDRVLSALRQVARGEQ
jgi:hypothetical protein